MRAVLRLSARVAGVLLLVGCTAPGGPPAARPPAATSPGHTAGTTTSAPAPSASTASPAPASPTLAPNGRRTLVLDGQGVGALRVGHATRADAATVLDQTLGRPRVGKHQRACTGLATTRTRTETRGPLTLTFVTRRGTQEVLGTWELDVNGSTRGFKLDRLPIRPTFAELRKLRRASVVRTESALEVRLPEQVTYRGPLGADRPTSVRGGSPVEC